LTDHANIYAALAAAQAEMSAPVKGSLNPAFRSKYADLADVVRAVAPALSAHGIAFYHYTQWMGSDIHQQLYMTTALVHGASDTRLECGIPLIVSKQDMHGFKSATTYAKRIGLESVTGVAPEDDDGNAAAKNPPARSRTVTRNDDEVVQSVKFTDPPTSYDIGTGEVRNPAQAASDGLRDAWLDGVKDQLTFDASDYGALHPAQKLQYWDAFATALVDAFARLKSAKGVSAQWDKRADLIEAMSEGSPKAFQRVQDAFDQRIRDFEDPFVLRGEHRIPVTPE
jgi:hypothetical protein